MSGFGSITFAVRWNGYDAEIGLFAAGCLIFLAMVFDGLDGAAARWTNQTSEFGAQLDSLCDAISFGAAPAILMLELAKSHGYHPQVLWVAAALYVVCALLRLARFNAASHENHEPGVFWGLPSPGAASVVASFPIMLFGPQLLSDGGRGANGAEVNAWAVRVMPIVTTGVACLMVSRVRYTHVFHWLLRKRRSGPYLIRVVFAVAIVVAIPWVAVPLLAGWYAFASPTVAIWNRLRQGPNLPQPPDRPPTAGDGGGDSGRPPELPNGTERLPQTHL